MNREERTVWRFHKLLNVFTMVVTDPYADNTDTIDISVQALINHRSTKPGSALHRALLNLSIAVRDPHADLDREERLIRIVGLLMAAYKHC